MEEVTTPVRIGIIDSGVNPNHPHVVPIAGGIHITALGTDENFLDFLGHGTAVAGAVREKDPDAALYAVKIFDRALSTSIGILLRALDWCLDERFDIINLSLGTLKTENMAAFEERIGRAAQLGIRIVSAVTANGQPSLPGSLAGVIGVEQDNACPRFEYQRRDVDGRTIYVASGYPRSIPGVPPERNLQGISFAVANVTGLLAAELGRERRGEVVAR